MPAATKVPNDLSLVGGEGSVPELSPVEVLALSKLTDAKSDRKKVEPGHYDVDFAVHVKGVLKVSLDSSARNKTLKPEDVLAKLAEKYVELLGSNDPKLAITVADVIRTTAKEVIHAGKVVKAASDAGKEAKAVVADASPVVVEAKKGSVNSALSVTVEYDDTGLARRRPRLVKSKETLIEERDAKKK